MLLSGEIFLSGQSIKIEYKYKSIKFPWVLFIAHLQIISPLNNGLQTKLLDFLSPKTMISTLNNLEQPNINKIREEDMDGEMLLRWAVDILMKIFEIKYKSANKIMKLVEEKQLSDSLQSMHVSTPGWRIHEVKLSLINDFFNLL